MTENFVSYQRYSSPLVRKDVTSGPSTSRPGGDPTGVRSRVAGGRKERGRSVLGAEVRSEGVEMSSPGGTGYCEKKRVSCHRVPK